MKPPMVKLLSASSSSSPVAEAADGSVESAEAGLGTPPVPKAVGGKLSARLIGLTGSCSASGAAEPERTGERPSPGC
eukprot:scaffold1291_cov256-Pinguiococcus_pyrenoidosus.AAC.6